MTSDTPKPTPPESSQRVNDPTSATLLADAHDQMISISVRRADGTTEQRPYEVHLPRGMKSDPANQHLPVVIAFDGTTANKPYTGMAVDNKLNAEADRDGFIAVYPLPKPRSVGLTIMGWNTGIAGKTLRDWNAPGVGSLPTDPNYNDVDYMKAVVTDVNQRFSPQPGIHAAAMSLGGEFLMDLNNKLPKGTFKDEYIVSSTVFGTEGLPVNAVGASVKIVRGEQDPILPQYGVMHQDFPFYKNAVMRGAEATVRTDGNCPPCMVNNLLTVNGYEGNAQPPTEHGAYGETVYNTPTGARIVVDTIHDAGHFWFGRETGGNHETIATDSNGVNPPVSAFDATRDMARFFGVAKE
jgi:poly(3-hydroxybutyrate) depolymerase